MATKNDLKLWVKEALCATGGTARLVEVAKHIWKNHHMELLSSGDLLYTWQYDMRWAANQLRRQSVMKPVEDSLKGVWELIECVEMEHCLPSNSNVRVL